MAESCLISVLLQTPLQTHSHRDGSQCNPGMFPASIQESGAGDGLDLEFSSSVLLFFLQQLEASVQCGARRGRVRRTRRPQAGKNQEFQELSPDWSHCCDVLQFPAHRQVCTGAGQE